jgi:hypothetical protein
MLLPLRPILPKSEWPRKSYHEIWDFVHSDGIDLSQNPVFEAPGDDVLDSIEDLFPGSTKRFGGFFPGQASRPAG